MLEVLSLNVACLRVHVHMHTAHMCTHACMDMRARMHMHSTPDRTTPRHAVLHPATTRNAIPDHDMPQHTMRMPPCAHAMPQLNAYVYAQMHMCACADTCTNAYTFAPFSCCRQ